MKARLMHPPIGMGLVQTSPSLALIKYWGKADSHANLPATPSVAVTLDRLRTETRVWAIDRAIAKNALADTVVVGFATQNPTRYSAFFDHLRGLLGTDAVFWAESVNNFPTSAGLASSSSGFAALAIAACNAARYSADDDLLSSLARIGSGSAARSIFGGFTLLPALSESAQVLHGHDWWPDLRILIVRLQEDPKEISSRAAMEITRLTSPFYESWVLDAAQVSAEAIEALKDRNLPVIGRLMRMSYLRMFATMFAADPPIVYWKPDSLAVIKMCEELRNSGIACWETMDAGPQVKILTTETDVASVVSAVEGAFGKGITTIDRPGPGPRIPESAELLGSPSTVLKTAAEGIGLDLGISA